MGFKLVIISSNWIKKIDNKYYGYPQWKFLEGFSSLFNNVFFLAPVKKVNNSELADDPGLRLNNSIKIIELPYFEGTVSQIKCLYLIFYLFPVYFKYIKKADVVFIFNRDIFSTIALFLSKALNKKTVFFIGDIWYKSLQKKYKNPIPVVVAKVLSSFQKRILSYKKENTLILATLNKDIEKEIKTWNLDYQRYFASLIRKSDIYYKELHPLSKKDCIKILYVGFLSEGKGVQDLIKAVFKLQKEIPNTLQLHIVGDGYYKENLMKLAKSEKVKAKFYGFIGDREHLKNIYRECDIFVLPSYTEGYPKVVFEAASQGCLVITSDIVELKDICLKYKTKDIDALVSILKKVIEDFQSFKTQIQTQYEIVQDYTLEKATTNIYNLIRKKWG